jgi:hypothetical protein
MVLELMFLLFLVLGLCVVAYRGAIHEYQILQKTYSPEINWSELFSEQLPVVIRNLPKQLLGGWTANKTSLKTWQVFVRDESGKKYKTTWNSWLAAKDTRQPLNSDELAEAAELDAVIDNWMADDMRRWSYVPPETPTPYVLSSTLPVHKNPSEFAVITATDGGPLEIWLAHEGAVSKKVARELDGKDPWTATSESVPWINTVKYVEIKLRPGNALLIPCHWWYALRPAEPQSPSWFWKSTFNTPISWMASSLYKK